MVDKHCTFFLFMSNLWPSLRISPTTCNGWCCSQLDDSQSYLIFQTHTITDVLVMKPVEFLLLFLFCCWLSELLYFAEIPTCQICAREKGRSAMFILIINLSVRDPRKLDTLNYENVMLRAKLMSVINVSGR